MVQHLGRKLAVCQAGSGSTWQLSLFWTVEIRAIADVNDSNYFFLSSKREHGFGVCCAPPKSKLWAAFSFSLWAELTLVTRIGTTSLGNLFTSIRALINFFTSTSPFQSSLFPEVHVFYVLLQVHCLTWIEVCSHVKCPHISLSLTLIFFSANWNIFIQSCSQRSLCISKCCKRHYIRSWAISNLDGRASGSESVFGRDIGYVPD
jgi:hypothetical protein